MEKIGIYLTPRRTFTLKVTRYSPVKLDDFMSSLISSSPSY